MPDPADLLARYHAKRDFSRTAEPAGTLTPGHGNLFMVQKHDATRLHWDFRIEIDGVLKSWAVTRGPSLDPAEKRLAVRTEDHPLSYATFEGTIPKGQYGGGTVMLWDRGTWSPIKGKSARDLDEGHLHFVLDGERMKGEWLLIRLKPRGREKAENWLLRKIADAEAGGTDTLTEEALTSVATGRTMAEIAEGAAAKTRHSRKHAAAAPSPRARSASGAKPAPQGFVEPQLCTLVDHVPTGDAWLHEIKYDGYRAIVAVAGGRATVFTRNGLDWTDRFPDVAAAAAALPDTLLIDGEIVAFKDGKPDFSTLKDAIAAGGAMTFFAFDLLAQDGADWRDRPLAERKARLRALIGDGSDGLRFSEHVEGSGETLFAQMCAEGLEGVVSKRADAPYRSGRSKGWLKAKCIQRQEFVVVGWQPSDKRRGFKSLLLAVRDGDGYAFRGKVGTGFTQATMADLRTRLDRIARKTAPVDAPRAAVRGAHWVTPRLVAEIAYAEVTPDGMLRHASFVGLREDKPAEQVVAETPVSAPASPPARAPAVTITHPDRVIFPETNVTKGDLAAYMTRIAPVMLAFAGDRPVSLVRCPQGRARACFFQKHDAGSFGDAVHQVAIREKDGSTENYLYVDDAAGLVTCVQMGSIEFHGWGSSVATLEQPDRMVFDLDPDEGLGFAETRKAAEYLRDRLGDLGLASVPLLSGGKGVHVVVPLTPAAEWPVVKDFASRFAQALAQAEPDRFVATMAKAKRKGRIFIDWLRNQRGATAILPYSARARAGAPVAAPVSWTELRELDSAARWTVRDADELIARAASPALDGWGRSEQVLPDL